MNAGFFIPQVGKDHIMGHDYSSYVGYQNSYPFIGHENASAQDQQDYKNAKILFYNYDGIYEIASYSSLVDEYGNAKNSTSLKNKAEKTQFTITGIDNVRSSTKLGRTGIGFRSDGTMVLVATEVGMTSEEFRNALNILEVVDYVILDGSGSTRASHNGKTVIQPSDGRSISSMFTIKSRDGVNH